MSGLDLANVKRIERESGRLKDEVSRLRRELEIANKQIKYVGTGSPRAVVDRGKQEPLTVDDLKDEAALIADLASLGLPAMTRQQRHAFELLKRRMPSLVTPEEIDRAVCRRSGKPSRLASVLVCKLRVKLSGSKWHIVTHQGRGFSLGVLPE